MDFLNALADPAIPFLRYALLTGIVASLAFGIIGTYVVARRITYIAGAISHCVLAGIGAGLYCQKALGIDWFGPLTGAIVTALIAALIIGLVSLIYRGGPGLLASGGLLPAPSRPGTGTVASLRVSFR